jgi:hypothetical protein
LLKEDFEYPDGFTPGGERVRVDRESYPPFYSTGDIFS